MEKQFMRVGTHSGRFHADEVMSTALLKELFNIEVVRSRDSEVLNQLDLVYDVGEGEFDHHQSEKKYRDNGTPYAACGLIWNRFGRDIIRYNEQTVSEEDIEYIFYHMDSMLIEGIDAADNGVKTCKTIIPTFNISAIISKFNPTWDSDIVEDNAFHDAVKLASTVFRNMLKQQFSVVKARSKVLEAYNKRIRSEILLLDKSYPWYHLIYEIDKNSEVLFVIYPKDSEHLIQTVRKNDGTYGDRKPLPLSWAGKRGEELCKITGIKDAIFCHSARFIASAGSLESILKMAELALAEPVPAEPEHAKEEGFLDILKKFIFLRRIRIKI